MKATELTEVWSLDFETTGRDPLEARPVSFTLARIRKDGTVAEEHSTLIDPGIPIPEEASAVHGITTEMAQDEGLPAAEAIAALLNLLGPIQGLEEPVVIFNARYDYRLLKAEAERHGEHRPTLLLLDPYVIDRAVDRYRKGKRTLSDVARHYGVTLAGAHDAGEDATAAARVFFEQAKRGLILPHPLEVYQATQARYYEVWRDGFIGYLRQRGEDPAELLESTWPE